MARSKMYKGYDIDWLRELGTEHPDFYLVAEYDALGDEGHDASGKPDPSQHKGLNPFHKPQAAPPQNKG